MKDENIRLIESISNWDANNVASRLSFMINQNVDELLCVINEFYGLYNMNIEYLDHHILITLIKPKQV